MPYLLDTNAWIEYLRDPASRVAQRLASHPAGEIFVCSIVEAELYRGALRSARPSHHRAVVDACIATFMSYPFDGRAADAHATIRVQLERIGLPIGPYDSMIAAIALVNGVTLVTHNTAEFSRVAGLALEDWQV